MAAKLFLGISSDDEYLKTYVWEMTYKAKCIFEALSDRWSRGGLYLIQQDYGSQILRSDTKFSLSYMVWTGTRGGVCAAWHFGSTERTPVDSIITFMRGLMEISSKDPLGNQHAINLIQNWRKLYGPGLQN